ncbi:hypothetical protein M569_04607, partial [Genlisea aurea]
MRKLCPNLDRKDGLETVLEVPIPEEMFNKMGSDAAVRWQNMRSLMRPKNPSALDRFAAAASAASSFSNYDFLLKLVGSAFIPYSVQLDQAVAKPIRDGPIESSTAKYIVKQYVAATGGLAALNSISSMYAVGQVKMSVVSDAIEASKRACEVGGFVLWQKNPDLWYLELVISGFKINAGSDGKIAWNQSSSSSNPTKGPPKALRRFFQGLDPRSTANLFLNTACVGETRVEDEDCFILRTETDRETLKSQSTCNTEIVQHTIWGYFSQRTGLLVRFQDSKLIKMKLGEELSIYETVMESSMEDYRCVDEIKIAHGGTTRASLCRHGTKAKKTWILEESWRIEEVDFNICGLANEHFLPPSD